MKPIIHFSHANGFPAPTYHQFFAGLKAHYQIDYIEMHGHDSLFPVTENWTLLVQELIRYSRLHYSRPVIGVGHSLGAVLNFLAAVEAPELFQCIIMLDAPVLGWWRSHLTFVAKRLGLIEKVTPAFRTKNRRTVWSSVEEAMAYFRTKKLFQHFTDECLHDYVTYGTIKTKQGIELKFDREIEYSIFRTLPHNLSRYRKALIVPAALIYASEHSVVAEADKKFMQRHFNIQMQAAPGTHLFPFEYPDVASVICRTAIEQLLKKAS